MLGFLSLPFSFGRGTRSCSLAVSSLRGKWTLSLFVIEDDLLVNHHVIGLLGHLAAELVKSTHNSIRVRLNLELLPVLDLFLELIAHVVSAELRQVSWSSVGDGPSIVGWLPCWGLLLITVSIAISVSLVVRVLDWITILVKFLLLLFNYFLYFLFILFDLELSLLLLSCEIDDGADISDVLPDGEELVHESQFKLLTWVSYLI